MHVSPSFMTVHIDEDFLFAKRQHETEKGTLKSDFVQLHLELEFFKSSFSSVGWG